MLVWKIALIIIVVGIVIIMLKDIHEQK